LFDCLVSIYFLLYNEVDILNFCAVSKGFYRDAALLITNS